MAIKIDSITYEDSGKLLPIDKKSKSYVQWYRAKQQWEMLQPEFADTMEDKSQHIYLKYLISLVEAEQTRKKSLNRDESMERLYRLVVAMQCPHLFLKKTSSLEESHCTEKSKKRQAEKDIRDLKEYQSIRDQFTRRLRKGMHRYFLYQTYVYRGTRDLDRPFVEGTIENKDGQRRKLSEEELMSLKEDIQWSYKHYLVQLDHGGYQIEGEIAVDQNLLEHCCEKAWLFPLAHIMLLRDVQYQMMGRRKYKKDILLSNDSSKFKLKRRSCDGKTKEEPVPVASWLSYEAAKELRDILLYHMKGRANTSLFPYTLKKKEKEDCQRSFVLWRIFGWNEVGGYEASCDFTVESWSEHLLAVPDCNPELLALRIGKARNLSTQQIDVLRKELPWLLWRKCNIKNRLTSTNKFLPDEVKSIEEIVKAIKEFLNPDRYYSYKSEQEDHPKEMIKASKKLLEYEVFREKYTDDQKNMRDVMCSIMAPRDLSDEVLYMSQAIDPFKKTMIPAFVRYYKKKLRKELRYYTQKQVLLETMGYQDVALADKDKLSVIETEIFQDIKKNMPKLSWGDITKKILQNQLSSQQGDSKRERNIEQFLKDNYKVELEKWNHALCSSGGSNQNEKINNLLFYELYSHLVKESLRLLEIRAGDSLEKLYMEYLQNNYQQEKTEWTE